MSILKRNNVHVKGTGDRAMIFAHGFGCDQSTWRFVAPCFEREFVTVLFDHVGAGQSHLSAYSSERYSTLSAYADDLIELGRELNFHRAVLVGHACGATIGALATLASTDMFERLIMIGPSARYLDDKGYEGGFSAEQMSNMLAPMATDYPRWASRMAPLFVGDPERPELTIEVIESFQHLDATVASDFARAAFYSDVREQLPHVKVRSLILQSRDNWISPNAAVNYVHQHMPDSKLTTLRAQGYFPHLTNPADTVAEIGAFLQDMSGVTPATGHRSIKPSVRALTRQAASLLAATSEPRADSTTRARREEVLDTLLARTGELQMQLGRYDMHALALQELLSELSGDLTPFALTLRYRSDHIARALTVISPDLSAHFEQTNFDLKCVLDRHEIYARRAASIPGLRSKRATQLLKQISGDRDWFDHTGATLDDWLAQIELLERDILKVVSLCFRIAHCALAVQRQLSHVSPTDKHNNKTDTSVQD